MALLVNCDQSAQLSCGRAGDGFIQPAGRQCICTSGGWPPAAQADQQVFLQFGDVGALVVTLWVVFITGDQLTGHRHPQLG